MELTFDNATKLYGPVIGINAVSCVVGPGITGLLGSNGAGKSTMLKLASGQLRPSMGQVRLGSISTWSAKARRELGYSPDINNFYEEMTGREFVRFLAALHGFSGREARRRTEIALEEVGMTDRAHRRIAGCSHGMRQRIKLAQALVSDPAVLLLDEPLSGIDPGGRHEINALLKRMSAKGKTILVSSHILHEIEGLADTLLVIAAGRVLASGTLHELRMLLADHPFTVEVATTEPRRMAALLVELPEVRGIELQEQAVVARTRNPVQFFTALSQVLAESDVNVRGVSTLDAGADAVFDYLQRGL